MFQLEAQLYLLYGKGRGRPRKDGRAFLVACKISNFYFQQLGKYPTVESGVDLINTGKYFISADSIFSVIGIEQDFKSTEESSVEVIK